MKNYIATFSRYNPQTFHSYETHFDISAEYIGKRNIIVYEDGRGTVLITEGAQFVIDE